MASAADVIVSDPGTLTGSIGVFALRPTIGGLLDKLEVGVDSLTRGRHADFLLSSEKLSAGSLARLQTSVEDTYRLFLDRVSEGRELAVEEVDRIGQGRVWTGRQARDLGLVDVLGGLHTAVREAKVAIDLDPEADVFLVPYPKQKSLSEQLIEALQLSAVRAADSANPLPQSLREGLPGPVSGLLDFSRLLPGGAPLLLPPVLVEIR